MITYRKIGGIHWLAIGRLRISWCLKREPITYIIPKAYTLEMALEAQRIADAQYKAKLKTWVPDEHNHFIF